MKKSRKPTTVRQATSIMTQVAHLYPNQDPIRLAAGIMDFKLPMKSTLFVLKRLAPRYGKEDMIRLAAGFNDIRNKVKTERQAVTALNRTKARKSRIK